MTSPTRATIIQAPVPIPPILPSPSLFLSGYISHPDSCWRAHLTTTLSHLPITILNPLRRDWAWPSDVADPRFVAQTRWELDGLERADVCVFHLAGTGGVVSLLELGVWVGGGKTALVCVEGGWAFEGNVRVLCERMGVRVFGAWEECVEAVGEVMGKLVRERGVEGGE